MLWSSLTGRRLDLDDTCRCQPLDAEMIEDIAWGSVTAAPTDPLRGLI
jgi:hypothetical protein